MIQQAYTARELAELQLKGWPHTKRNFNALAARENWQSRPRNKQGGGREYPLATLPPELHRAIYEKALENCKPEALLKPVEGMEAATENKDSDKRLKAKLLIVQQFDRYRDQFGFTNAHAEPLFVHAYARQAIETPDKIPYNVYASFSIPSLRRWRQLAKTQPAVLGGRYGKRAGQSNIARANHGELARYITALLVDNRHYKAGHLRDMSLAKFGKSIEVNGKPLAMPGIRSFERFVEQWKDENTQVFMAITAPGAFKNKMRVAVGNAAAHVERLNQEWQIDATPADAFCKDGRYSIYAIIDIYSRRVLFSVSKTAKTEASLSLVRRAILEWGMPEVIKTDNGSDFISKRFKEALLLMGIDQQISPPYSPEKKPFVERVIGTAARDLMAILPGFAGHNVADRQRIREQKEFAARIGEKDDAAFSVEMTSEELQQVLDKWAGQKYAKRPHDSLGVSPDEMAATWPDAVRKPTDIRALDILLAPIATGGGYRQVTKSGIRIDHYQYLSEATIPYIGKRVLVRHDPADMGTIYAFDDKNNFLFEAISPELNGISPLVFAKQMHAAQKAFIAEKKKPINADRRKLSRMELAEAYLESNMESSIIALPRQAEAYSNEALEQAGRAVKSDTPTQTTKEDRMLAAKAALLVNEQKEKELTSEERWVKRLEGIDAKQAANQPLSENDANWLVAMENQPWLLAYRAAQKHKAEAKAQAEALRAQMLAEKETSDHSDEMPDVHFKNNKLGVTYEEFAQ